MNLKNRISLVICLLALSHAVLAQGVFKVWSNGVYIPFDANTVDSIVFSLEEKTDTGIVIIPSSVTLAEGETYQLEAKLIPSGEVPVNPDWSSLNPETATVDNTGLLTAVAAGTAIIQIWTSEGSRLSATCTVTVTSSGKEPRVCYLASDNYGNNNLYVDGKQFSKSTDLVYDIAHEGADLYYYVYNDGFYKEKEKIASFDNTAIGTSIFKDFTVKNGLIHIFLAEKASATDVFPSFVRVHTINIATGVFSDVKLNSEPFSDINSCGNETSVCAGNDGAVYVLGRCKDASRYYSTILWKVTPSDGGAAKVEEHVLFKGTSDLTTTACDLETGPDGSIYALVSCKSTADGKNSYVLFKDFTEVRRYEGYSDTNGYYPHGLSVDGTDVYLFLKRTGEKTADIFKNAEKVKSNFTNCQAGYIAADGKGGYYYVVSPVNVCSSKLYHSAGTLLYSQNVMMSKLLVAR